VTKVIHYLWFAKILKQLPYMNSILKSRGVLDMAWDGVGVVVGMGWVVWCMGLGEEMNIGDFHDLKNKRSFEKSLSSINHPTLLNKVVF